MIRLRIKDADGIHEYYANEVSPDKDRLEERFECSYPYWGCPTHVHSVEVVENIPEYPNLMEGRVFISTFLN